MRTPKRLQGAAREKWKEVFSEFAPASPLDVEAACQYCEAWADYIHARDDIERMGTILTAGKNGAPYQNPAIGTKNKAIDQMRRLYQRLAPMLKNGSGDDFGDL